MKEPRKLCSRNKQFVGIYTSEMCKAKHVHFVQIKIGTAQHKLRGGGGGRVVPSYKKCAHDYEDNEHNDDPLPYQCWAAYRKWGQGG